MVIGAVLFSMRALNTNSGSAKSIAGGSIYISVLALALIFNVAIIFPACLLLQPFRLWRIIRAEKQAITPRQRFRGTHPNSWLISDVVSYFIAVYPRTYNPSFAISACILAIVFASTFALIFPLISPAVVILLFLTLIGM